MWDDDWTVVTRDRKRTAQFEHTLLVTAAGAEVLDPSREPRRVHSEVIRPSHAAPRVRSCLTCSGVRRRRGVRRDVRRDLPARAVPTAGRRPCSDLSDADLVNRVEALQSSLPRPGRHVRLRRRGAAVPARRRAARHRAGHVGDHRGAASSSGSARSRRSSPTSTTPGRSSPTASSRARSSPRRAHFHREAAGHRAAQRRAHPRRRHRPDPRRARRVPGARGQRPRAVRGQLRDDEPAGDAAALPELFADHRDPPGRRLPAAAAGRAARRGAGRRQRPDGRRAHARRLQLAPTSSTRCSPAPWASSSSRAATCMCRRGRVLMRTTHGLEPVARDLPPRRRRVPRPACSSARDSVLGCPGLIDAARARARHDRQRGRQRRRRRQARLHLRARPHPLLPRRGADPAATSTPGGSATPRPREEVLDRLDELVRQAGRRLGRQGHRHRPGRRPRASSTSCRARSWPTRAAGSPSPSSSCRRSRRSSTDGMRPAARRPAPVRGERRRATCGCCPAG